MASTKPRDEAHEARNRSSAAESPIARKEPALLAHGEAPQLSTRIARVRDTIPWVLLAALLLIGLLIVFTQAHRYGITVDETLQQPYGERVLAWYTSHGRNISFLAAYPSDGHMPEHGGIVDAGIAALQRFFSETNPWLVRHIATGLLGWLGVVAIALCGYELGGPWVAFAAALGLWLYPRYYGAIYNNPKDIPAAASMAFVLWATLLLVKRWNRSGFARVIAVSALLGLCLGAATAIRVTALTWYAILVALFAGWWIINGVSAWRERRVIAELARHGVAAGTITISWLLSTMALWPYVFLHPLANLIRSVRVMVHYPWPGLVLYNGVEELATQLPASYAPTWIVIGSPPMLLLLAVAGLLLALAETARTRRINPATATVVMAFVIPLASLVLLHPVLYDTLRQFLYIMPPLIVLAAYGLVRGVSFLLSQRRIALRWIAGALLAVTIASYAMVAANMVALSPYEYAYFSPLVGGLQGASGKYDTDYYGTCDKAAAMWLSQNYRHYTNAPSPTVDASVLLRGSIAPFLPASLHESAAHPDFFIGFTRNNSDLKYPGYRVIHVVATEGVPLCVVKANPATTQSG